MHTAVRVQLVSRPGIECSHVGHPFFDQAADYPIDEELVRTIRGTGAQPVVALLPGSRRHEIAANWEVQLQIASKISAEIPEVRWVVGSYREDQLNLCQEIQQRIHPELRLAYQLGKTPEVIAAADFCLLVSGSISLELLARHRPGIVLYRIGSISRFLSRFLMHCRFITLPNLIAERELMPEFISSGNPQSDITEIAEISSTGSGSPMYLPPIAAKSGSCQQQRQFRGPATMPPGESVNCCSARVPQTVRRIGRISSQPETCR